MKQAWIQSPAWFRVVLATTFAAVAGWQLWALGFGDPVLVAKSGMLKDDAFFYSVLVDNLFEHGFFTLDGEMHTNGFQPLWMLVLAAFKSVLRSTETPRLLQGLSWALWLAFSWGAIWLVSSGTTFAASVRSLLVAGLLVNNSRIQQSLVSGLEVPLALALVVWTLVYVERLDRRTDEEHPLGVRAGAVAGALGGLIFLARTDLFWLVPVLALWTYLRSNRDWRPPLACMSVVAAIAGPYLLWNLLAHGALMPISGRVKLYYMQTFYPTWDAYWASDEWQGLPRLFEQVLPKLSWSRTVGVSAVLFISANAVAWSPWGRRRLPDSLRLLSAASTAHAIYMYAIYRELRPYTSYYFAPEVLLVVLTLAWWVAEIRGRVSAVAIMIWVLMISNVRWDATKLAPVSYWKTRVELAQKLPELTRGEPLGAFWPGALAAFSGLDVVPLDGVIGSQEFFTNYLKEGREIDYLQERGIRWIVVAARRSSAITGSREPKIPEWSVIGQVRAWEARDHLRHAYGHGPWHLFELDPDG